MEFNDVRIATGERVDYSQMGSYPIDLLLIIVGGLVMLVLPIAFTGSFALAVIKKSKGWGISSVIFGVLSIVATAALLFLARSATFAPSGPKTVEEWRVHELPDGMQIEVLKNWEKSKTGEGSVVFTSPAGETTFGLIVESREHFSTGFPLAAYAEFYAEQIDDQLGKEFRRSRLKRFTADGRDGFRSEIQHLADPPAEIVLVAFLENGERFYRMVGSCSLRNSQQVEDVLESIRFRKKG